jgi:integrase
LEGATLMASVRKLNPKDPKSPWIVTYIDGGGKRRQATPKSGLKKDADAIRISIERELGEGTHMAKSETAYMRDVAEEWLRHIELKAKIGDNMKLITAANYKTFALSHVVPDLGSKLISKITANDITSYLANKRLKLSKATTKLLHCVLLGIFTYAVRHNYLKRNVMVDFKVRAPSSEAERIRVPSIAEVKRLLQVLDTRVHKGDRLVALRRRAGIPLAAFCGLRLGEICALKWEHVRFDKGVIEVRHSFNRLDGLKLPKSKAGLRDVPISPIDLAPLMELFSACKSPTEGYVFETRAGHPYMPAKFYDAIWAPVLEKAGWRDANGKPKYHFHALRHVAASLMIQDGLTPLHVKRFIGHAHASTTLDIYGHLFPEDMSIAASVNSVAAAFKAAELQHLTLTD